MACHELHPIQNNRMLEAMIATIEVRKEVILRDVMANIQTSNNNLKNTQAMLNKGPAKGQ